MTLTDRLDRRFSQPGDDETTIARKRLSVYVFGAASLLTFLFGMWNLGTHAPLGGYYMGLGASIGLLWVLMLALPRYWLAIVSFIIVVPGTLEPLLGHVISGGYTQGTVEMTWTLIGPILAVVFVPNRAFVLSVTLLSVGVLVGGAFLEPVALARTAPLPLDYRVQGTTSNLVVLLGILVVASLYMFRQVEKARAQADALLLNVLPEPISLRLKASPEVIADGYSEATVLFADIVDFTNMSARADPIDVVNKLNEVFSDFDDLAGRYGLEKIKTIGDAYMVAAGLPSPQADHVQRTVRFAEDMLVAASHHTSWTGEPILLRIGINTGPVVAGVIGRHKFIYDLWGDAVNVASRMESNGLANRIQVTEAVKERLDGQYVFEARGPIDIKGKGLMMTYVLVERASGAPEAMA